MSVQETHVVKLNSKKYELVPPDGGWGYMIWIAAIINFATTFMFTQCFGMIFDDFLVELDMGSASVTLLGGINNLSLALAGYFTSPLLKVLSLRSLSLLASVLLNVGVFCTVFVRSPIQLYICQGILQSAGSGILYNLSCSMINKYFLKKRLLSISVTQSMAAVAEMLAPQFIRWALEGYGFRGTLLFISGVSLQSFVAVIIMQPVEWHMKKVEVNDGNEEDMKLLSEEKRKKNSQTINGTSETLTKDVERSANHKIEANDERVLSQSLLSLPSIKPTPIEETEIEGDSNFKTFLKHLFDAQLLKKFFLSSATLGPSLAGVADYIFILMIPQALYSIGWEKDGVAKALSLTCFGDLITRLAFVFLSKWMSKIGTQEIYLFGIAMTIATRIGVVWSQNPTIIFAFFTLMGMSRCILNVLPPLILSEVFTSEQFTAAMGIFMMVFGLLMLVIGPAIGAVRDYTGSYTMAFNVTIVCFCAILVVWSTELCYINTKQRRKLQAEEKEDNNQTVNTM